VARLVHNGRELARRVRHLIDLGVQEGFIAIKAALLRVLVAHRVSLVADTVLDRGCRKNRTNSCLCNKLADAFLIIIENALDVES
jgi:hypothetical protein